MSDKKTKEKLSIAEKINGYINNKSKCWKIAVGIISTIVLILFAAGTFTLPFIKFSSRYNKLMICIWLLLCVLFFGIVTFLFMLDRCNNKNEVEKLKKDKFIYIYSHGLLVVIFAITLLLSFLNNSFNCKFNILNILFFSAIGFFIIGFIISSFINDKKKFFKNTLKSILLLFAVFCILSGYYQIEPANEIEKSTRIARVILIVGGFSIVIVMACLTISNWISDVTKKNKSLNALFAIALFVGCIILSTILILNLPYDEKVIGNIVTVFAGVVGGVLTLVGVLMEIRHQERVRKEDKLEEYKPWFTAYTDWVGEDIKTNTVKCYMFSRNENENLYIHENHAINKLSKSGVLYEIPHIIFKNTDQSNFIIKKITINGCESYQKNNIIRKSDDFYLYNLLIIDDDGSIPEVLIHTVDILKNKYVFKVVFEESVKDKVFKNKSQTEEKTVKYVTLKVVNIEEVLIDKI